jgi:hypothetical protein
VPTFSAFVLIWMVVWGIDDARLAGRLGLRRRHSRAHKFGSSVGGERFIADV